MFSSIISLTKSLISLPSIRNNKKVLNKVLDLALKEVKDFTIERFEKEGFPSVLIYSQKTRPKKFKIILNAHLDGVSRKEEAKKLLKKNIKTIVKHGGSDIRHFNQVGCQGVTFGPIGGDLHGDNEWVDIKSLEKYFEILWQFFKNNPLLFYS